MSVTTYFVELSQILIWIGTLQKVKKVRFLVQKGLVRSLVRVAAAVRLFLVQKLFKGSDLLSGLSQLLSLGL